MYELLLTIHFITALLWVGGGYALTIMAHRADQAGRMQLAPHLNFYGGKVIPIASVILLLAGIGLVLHLDHVKFSQAWIIIALVGFVISAFLGARILSPLGEKLQSATGAEAEALYGRLMKVSYLDTVIVTLIVIDMAVKPGL